LCRLWAIMDRIQFQQQVSDLYIHLYDLVYLRTHPLTDVLVLDAAASRKQKGWQLHNLLLEAINELDPGPRAPPYSREWRRYRLMVERYKHGLEPGAIMQEIAVSKRQYYREHEAAIEAIACVLWEHYIAQSSLLTSPAATPAGAPTSYLELLRLETARTAQAGRYAHLNDIVSGAVALLGEKLRHNKLNLDLTLPEALPAVAADQALLRQMVLGMIGYLVERASDATLQVNVVADEAALLFSLQIDPVTALRPTAFAEAQERCAAFAEMGALIGVSSRPLHAGPTVIGFQIRLPAETRRAVLVVDDNEDVLEFFRRCLAPHGYRVLAVTSGQQALDLASQLQPYAITLDLMLPGEDGWNVLQNLLNRPRTRRIPVIICSVLKQKELALSLGAAAFLAKPVTERELLAALQALEARQPAAGLA